VTGHLGVIAAMDALFERVVGDPASCGDELLSAWLQDALAGLEPPVDKALAREVRKAARLAGRLARFWSDPDRSSRLPAEWQQAVDAALGSTGWEPSLEVARMGLDAEPSAALFDEVRRRWRQVRFAPWLEGVTYQEWLSAR
jgi:hypothetical protein